MPSYQLSNAAGEDLSDLYSYSYFEFGEHRADAYFESLEDCLRRLADNPKLGMDVSGIRQGYFRFVHQQHSVYYKRSRSGIFIVRILGPGMSTDGNLP